MLRSGDARLGNDLFIERAMRGNKKGAELACVCKGDKGHDMSGGFAAYIPDSAGMFDVCVFHEVCLQRT